MPRRTLAEVFNSDTHHDTSRKSAAQLVHDTETLLQIAVSRGASYDALRRSMHSACSDAPGVARHGYEKAWIEAFLRTTP